MLQPAPSTCLFLSSLLQSARCELFFRATSKLPSHKLRREKTSNKSIWPRVSLAREPSLAHVRALSPLLGKMWPWHHNSKSYLCYARLFFLCCHLQHLIVQSEAAPKSRWWSVGRSVVICLMCVCTAWSDDQNVITPTELTTATSPSQTWAVSKLRAISNLIWQPKWQFAIKCLIITIHFN